MASNGVTRPPALDVTMQEILDALKAVSFRPQVIDNLTSQDTGAPLSANQGRVLKSAIDGLVTQSITDGDTAHAPSGDAVHDAINAITEITNLSTEGWTSGSYFKKQGNHVFGLALKSVSVTVANGRNYNLECAFPFTVSRKHIFIGTAYISSDNSYAPASFELEGNSDLICIVGSQYNGKTITALYIFVDAYL